MTVRDVAVDDARRLAFLINLAGEGLTETLWRRLAGRQNYLKLLIFAGFAG